MPILSLEHYCLVHRLNNYCDSGQPGRGGYLSHYQTIYNYIKSIEPSWKVILNPGDPMGYDFLTPGAPAGDIVVDHEDPMNQIGVHKWNAEYPSQMAYIAYEAHKESGLQYVMRWVIKNYILAKGYGYIYYTDDKHPQQYDNLSGFWTEMIDFIQAKNAGN